MARPDPLHWIRRRRVAGLVSAAAESRLAVALRPLARRLTAWGLLSPVERFVLILGDEGASLIRLQGRRVVDALFVAADAEEGLETFRGDLLRSPRAPVSVAVDVLEQMYREEVLPRVGRFDRLTIIRRRLDVAFPRDRLKAALPLGRAKDEPEAVLFTALPMTETVGKWTAFLESLPNPVVGFCLLPLESDGVASRLTPAGEGDGRAVWQALVTQQATSGFRQIFSLDGHLMVTRLTPTPPGEFSADGAAMLIERELRSSISYIKRLGYSEADRLDLVVLARKDILDAVGRRELPVSRLIAMTPRQAGEKLGFGAVGPEDGTYADILHAQELAFKRRPRTVLPTEALKLRLVHDQLFKAGFVTAAALALLAVFYLGSTVFDAADALSTADTLEGTLRLEATGFSLLRQKTKGYEIPIEDLLKFVEAEDALRKAEVDPNDVLRRLAGLLDPATRVEKVVFSSPMPSFLPRPAGTPPSGAVIPRAAPARKDETAAYEIQLTVRIPADEALQPDQSARWVRGLKDRLAGGLPGFDVGLVPSPAATARAQVLEGTAGQGGVAKPAGPAFAAYVIRKRS